MDCFELVIWKWLKFFKKYFKFFLILTSESVKEQAHIIIPLIFKSQHTFGLESNFKILDDFYSIQRHCHFIWLTDGQL